MQLADMGRALALGLALVAAAQAAETRYGKVETFQPGKKYTCVPTSDRKGWDCTELDKAGAERERAPSAAAAASGETATRPAEPASSPEPPAPPPATAAPPAAPSSVAPTPARAPVAVRPAYRHGPARPR